MRGAAREEGATSARGDGGECREGADGDKDGGERGYDLRVFVREKF